MSPFTEILEFNLKRRLIENGFDKVKEASFITEEITELLRANTDEDEIDALADIIVFAVGAMYKKGYDAQKCLNEVCKHINSETGGYYDDGIKKYIKGERTYSPDFASCKI